MPKRLRAPKRLLRRPVMRKQQRNLARRKQRLRLQLSLSHREILERLSSKCRQHRMLLVKRARPLASQQAVNQQAANQQAVNQQAANQQAVNQQAVNQQAVNQQVANQQVASLHSVRLPVSRLRCRVLLNS